MDIMTSGTVRLKGRELLEKYGVSMYRVAADGGLSYPTVHKYLTRPDDVQHMSLDVLYGLLRGVGLTSEQAAQLKLGDLFEFVDAGNATE